MFASITTALDAIAVPIAVLPKSNALSSPTTAVIPSRAFNSAAVDVTPSSMFSSAAVLVTAVPLIDNASVSKVPSTSTLPETSSEPASNSPVSVILRKPVASLFASTTTALEAATVPAVIPSILSKSFSLISALPITKLPPVIAPVVVIVDDPLSMLPKPDVMLPLFNAPVAVMLVVVRPSTYALIDC